MSFLLKTNKKQILTKINILYFVFSLLLGRIIILAYRYVFFLRLTLICSEKILSFWSILVTGTDICTDSSYLLLKCVLVTDNHNLMKDNVKYRLIQFSLARYEYAHLNIVEQELRIHQIVGGPKKVLHTCILVTYEIREVVRTTNKSIAMI